MFLFSVVTYQSFRCVKTLLTCVRLFSRSYPIAVHIELKLIYVHFVRIDKLQGQFCKEKRMAQFTFLGFTKLISHISFTIIRVNCAFLAVTDFAITAMPLAKV